MQKFENLMGRLDHITQDVAELKKSLLVIQVRDSKKSEEAACRVRCHKQEMEGTVSR